MAVADFIIGNMMNSELQCSLKGKHNIAIQTYFVFNFCLEMFSNSFKYFETIRIKLLIGLRNLF